MVGVATATTRPTAPLKAVLPALIGARWPPLSSSSASCGARFAPATSDRPRGGDGPHATPGLDRRGFLFATAVVAAGRSHRRAAGRSLHAVSTSSAVRSAIALPAPASAAAAQPATADLGIAGFTPFVTPNDAFYRVDTALIAPQVSPTDWSLTVKGMVDRDPLVSPTDDLLARDDVIERDITLVCISNEVGRSLRRQRPLARRAPRRRSCARPACRTAPISW